MTGIVEIVNIALARLGDSPIQGLTEGSVPANMATVFYEPSRRAVLRDFNWNFALRTARLAKLQQPGSGFRYAFSLPADCLRVVSLLGSTERGTGPGFVVRSGNLLTDKEDAEIEYIYDCQDPALFDDKFIEALSYKLASELAMPVKGSPELMGNYMNVYQAFVEQAATLSSEERRPELLDNPYLEARFYGHY
jgi:hypothetical protein